MLKKIIAFLFFVILTGSAFSQGFNPYAAYGEPQPRKNTLRVILNKITFSASGGYGANFYSHLLQSGTLLRKNDQLFYSPENTSDYYRDWLNFPTIPDTLILTDANFYSLDTNAVRFNGIGSGIPLMFSIHVQIERFRIGGGASFEFHQIANLTPNIYQEDLGSYNSNPNTSVFSKYYGMLAGEYFRIGDYHYIAELLVGIMKYGKGFDQSNLQPSLFFNLGAPIEKEFSEYFRVFLRPSLEYKSYEMALPGTPQTIRHTVPAAYVSLGFRYNIPETPRCPIAACQTQLKHRHKHLGSKEYRGQPFYKRQNPKIGENYPKLHRYKGKNKRKRSGGY